MLRRLITAVAGFGVMALCLVFAAPVSASTGPFDQALTYGSVKPSRTRSSSIRRHCEPFRSAYGRRSSTRAGVWLCRSGRGRPQPHPRDQHHQRVEHLVLGWSRRNSTAARLPPSCSRPSTAVQMQRHTRTSRRSPTASATCSRRAVGSCSMGTTAAASTSPRTTWCSSSTTCLRSRSRTRCSKRSARSIRTCSPRAPAGIPSTGRATSRSSRPCRTRSSLTGTTRRPSSSGSSTRR